MALLAFISLFFSLNANAKISTDFGALYFSDTDSRAEYSTYSRLFWDLSLNISLDKKSFWMLGWTYGSYTFTDSSEVDNSLTATGMGPKLTYFIDKQREWSLAFIYFLVNTGNSKVDGDTSELRGTMMKAEFSYMPQLGQSRFYLGGKLNYYRSTFPEEVDSNTLETVSYHRSAIYPSLAITALWD